MAPILNYGLPAIGVYHIFPRKMVFAPTAQLGLRLQHIPTTQEILHIKDILNHTF